MDVTKLGQDAEVIEQMFHALVHSLDMRLADYRGRQPRIPTADVLPDDLRLFYRYLLESVQAAVNRLRAIEPKMNFAVAEPDPQLVYIDSSELPADGESDFAEEVVYHLPDLWVRKGMPPQVVPMHSPEVHLRNALRWAQWTAACEAEMYRVCICELFYGYQRWDASQLCRMALGWVDKLCAACSDCLPLLDEEACGLTIDQASDRLLAVSGAAISLNGVLRFTDDDFQPPLSDSCLRPLAELFGGWSIMAQWPQQVQLFRENWLS